MNQSIMTSDETTTDAKVREYTDLLICNRGKRFVATFIKQNGDVRSMTFVPRNEYNKLIGIGTTHIGRKIVRSKAMKDMITVVEILSIGCHEVIQPRTINLRTIIDLKVAA